MKRTFRILIISVFALILAWGFLAISATAPTTAPQETVQVAFHKVELRHIQRVIITRDAKTGEPVMGVHFTVESVDGKFNRSFQERMALSPAAKTFLANWLQNEVLPDINTYLGF